MTAAEKKIAQDSPPAPKRRARAPHRKTDHSVIERRRREKINDRLLQLQQLVPACRAQALEYFEKKSPDGPEDQIRTELVLEKLCVIAHTVGTWRCSHRLCIPAPDTARGVPRPVPVRAEHSGAGAGRRRTRRYCARRQAPVRRAERFRDREPLALAQERVTRGGRHAAAAEPRASRAGMRRRHMHRRRAAQVRVASVRGAAVGRACVGGMAPHMLRPAVATAVHPPPPAVS